MVYNYFVIDKLTIEERVSGKIYEATIQSVTAADFKKILKKYGWKFNWKEEYLKENRQVFKLVGGSDVSIQGLISLEIRKNDLFIEMHLIESAPHNFGKNKRYLRVANNMVAFACKMSFELGFEGYVGFFAKTKLILHYMNKFGQTSGK